MNIKKAKGKRQKAKVVEGFTLLEVLVSVTIIAGLSIVIAQSFFSTTRSSTKTEILKEVKQNGDVALGIIGNRIRASHQITSTCAASGTTSTSLSVKNPDGATTTFGCALDSGVTRIASSSGGTTDYLTSQTVTLGGAYCTDAAMSLSFTCTKIPGGGNTVKITFTLSQKGTPVALFERAQSSFQTTIDLRNK